MTRRTILTGAAACALSGCTTISPAIQAPGWKLVWADEFKGSSLDRKRWTVAQECWGGGNNERQCYIDSTDTARVANGVLTITARKQVTTGPDLPASLRADGQPQAVKTQEYRSAKLTTESSAAWLYGKVDVRAKLPLGQGTWPAIWMLPRDWAYGKWASSGEIDILETVNLGAPCSDCPSGKDDRVLGTLHYGGVQPKNTHKGEELSYPSILDGGFHDFQITWSPEKIEWTVDGRLYAVRTADEWYTTGSSVRGAPFDKPFYVILNLAVGGGLPESRDLKTVDERAFPAEFQVDYVRVWQRTMQAASRKQVLR